MRLGLICETCGSQIADPPKTNTERPVRVCCRASLAKAKGSIDLDAAEGRLQHFRGWAAFLPAASWPQLQVGTEAFPQKPLHAARPHLSS